MIEHSKAVAGAVGLLAAVPGIVASLFPWLNDLRTLLVVMSLMVAMGTGLLGLWFRKLIRDREDEREASEEKRDERLDARLRRIEQEVAATKGLFQETLAKSEVLRQEVNRAIDEARRAHARLDAGRETFAKLEVRVAAIGALQRGRFIKDGDSDG